MGRTFQHSSLFDGLTARENVAIAAQRSSVTRATSSCRPRRYARRRRTLGGAARARRPGRPRRRRGRVALLRPPPPARGRARPRDRADAAAPRRADRRHVAGRGAAVPAADRRPSRRADDHDRRARHGRRLRARDGDLRARRGPSDRERPAGGDPDVGRRAGGVPRTRRPDGASCSRRERLLEIRGVRAGYDAGDVLQGVDLELPQGEVVALLGRNGVGKTTLMNTIVGLVRPRAGVVLLDGRELAGASPHRSRAPGSRSSRRAGGSSRA